MSTEAMKLALEALEGLIKKTSGQSIYSFMETERRIAMSACVGIKEALALAEQPAQKQEPWEHLKAYGYAPGGYMMTCRGCNSTVTGVDKRASRCMPCATKAAEQPAQPMHPEIKKMYEDYFDKCFRESSPAQRTWVGLTGAEITTSIPYSVTRDKGCFHAGALWADDKLKEKNT